MEKDKKAISAIMNVFIAAITLIVVFIIFIYFFGEFPWYKAIDREACHQSIIQRSTFNLGTIYEPGRTSIPLQCKTEKICLKKSGEVCQEFPKNSFLKKEVTEIKIEERNPEISLLDSISDAMYYCHQMLGEGKADFMPSKTYEKNYCLICSRIAFSQGVKAQAKDITYGELYRYLQQKKDNEGNTYLSFIFPGWENWEVSKTLFEEVKKQNPSLADSEYDDWKIDLDQEGGYAIIAQMQTEGRFTQYGSTIGVAGIITGASVAAIFTGGLSLLALPAAIGIVSTGLAGGAVLGGAAYIITTPKGNKYTAPSIHPYDLASLKAIECTSFETAPS